MVSQFGGREIKAVKECEVRCPRLEVRDEEEAGEAEVRVGEVEINDPGLSLRRPCL